MDEESKPDADDDRPPICPACGVTMGIVVVECGFTDEVTFRSVSDGRPTDVGV